MQGVTIPCTLIANDAYKRSYSTGYCFTGKLDDR
jgi:hypothetical protein